MPHETPQLKHETELKGKYSSRDSNRKQRSYFVSVLYATSAHACSEIGFKWFLFVLCDFGKFWA
jgi:hypothetical protein